MDFSDDDAITTCGLPYKNSDEQKLLSGVPFPRQVFSKVRLRIEIQSS